MPTRKGAMHSVEAMALVTSVRVPNFPIERVIRLTFRKRGSLGNRRQREAKQLVPACRFAGTEEGLGEGGGSIASIRGWNQYCPLRGDTHRSTLFASLAVRLGLRSDP